MEAVQIRRQAPSLQLNILIAAGPPVFIVGLMLLLSWVLERMLLSFESQVHTESNPHVTFFVLLAIITSVACLFGWRVDINDFSMHAFYRDRLARCYAGASNPDRRPNPFTGFAASDRRIRLVDLLPALLTIRTPKTCGLPTERTSPVRLLQTARHPAKLP